jgi:hypothetical protein
MKVYTTAFGSYGLYGTEVYKGVDCIAYVDRERANVSGWRQIVVPLPWAPVKTSKLYKIMLPDDEYSLWVDASIPLWTDPKLLVDGYLGKHDMALFRHPNKRKGVYAEAEAVKAIKKWKPEEVDAQMAYYREQGMPENYPEVFPACTILLRKNTPRMREFAARWWEQVFRFTGRDQLSFSYVAWKMKLDWATLPGNIFGRHHPTFVRIRNLENARRFG